MTTEIAVSPRPQAGAPLLIRWVDQEHLASMIDAWAVNAHAGGAYDLAAHSLLADMTLEAGELVTAATEADMSGDSLTAYALRGAWQSVTREALNILAGLLDGIPLDDLVCGREDA